MDDWLDEAAVLARHRRAKPVATHGWVTIWRCGCMTTPRRVVHLNGSCTTLMRQAPFRLFEMKEDQ